MLTACELFLKARPIAIVETGTYLGETTEWLSALQVPVYSCEAIEENFGYASGRLVHINNIKVIHSDSRAALTRFLSTELATKTEEPIFFYLDAHWYDDLPLADELHIVFSVCPKALVMVDDFQIPNDRGYTFDNYGPGKALTAEYISSAVEKFDLLALYPTLPSSNETGAKRGCVVLVNREFANTLPAFQMLAP